MVAMIPVLNVLGVWVLAHYAAPGGRLARVAIAIAQNPLIWACFIGLALNPVPA